MTFIIASVVLFCLSLTGYLYGSDSDLRFTYGACLILLICYILLLYKAGCSKNKKLYNWGLRPSYLCLLGLLIVNFQFWGDDVLGVVNIDNSSNCSWAEKYSDKVFYGSFIFVLFFLIGNHIINTPFKFRQKKANNYNLTPWVLFSVMAFSGFLYTIDIHSFISGNIYIGSGAWNADAGISQSFEHLLNVLICITFALYTLNGINSNNCKTTRNYVKEMPWPFWIVFLGYLMLKLPSGDRGPFMYNTLILFYSYTIYMGKTIGLKKTLVLLAGAVVFISLLGFLRTANTNLSLDEKITDSIERMEKMHQRKNISISPYTSELAKSVRCNFVAVRDIENGETDYSTGKFLALTSLSSLPGAKTSYFNELGFNNEDIYSSIYITKSYNGSDFYSFGLGSSAFAEAYLEFGLIGLILIGFILGIIMKKCDLTFINSKFYSPYILLSVLVISSISFYISRSSFSYALGQVVYICALFFILSVILKIIGVYFVKKD